MVAVGIRPDAEQLVAEHARRDADADGEHADAGVVGLAGRRHRQLAVFGGGAVRDHDGDVAHVQTVGARRAEDSLAHHRQRVGRVRARTLLELDLLDRLDDLRLRVVPRHERLF